MSKGMRIGFLVLALAVIVVAVVLVGSGGDNDGGTAKSPSTAVTTEVATTPDTVTTTTAPKPQVVLLKAGKEPKLTYKKGDTVRFRVVSTTAEEVHVHGYDLMYDLEPGKVKTVTFPAKLEGVFEIELENSATPLAKLVVNPK